MKPKYTIQEFAPYYMQGGGWQECLLSKDITVKREAERLAKRFSSAGGGNHRVVKWVPTVVAVVTDDEA